METRDRAKILKQLSRSWGEKAQSALERAAEKSRVALLSSYEARELSGALADLEIFAFRVSHVSAEILSEFFSRVEREWMNIDASTYPVSHQSDVRGSLISEAMTILEQIRYFEMATVVERLLPYTTDQLESLRKQSIDGLTKCAVYDINVFFSGEGRAGLGAAPQIELLETVKSDRERWIGRYPEALAAVCAQLLSPSMESTSLHYDTVTWATAAIPATNEIKKIRSDAMELLFEGFNRSQSTSIQIAFLNALMTATETPRGAQLNEGLISLVEYNTLSLFSWLRKHLRSFEFSVLQKVEHQVYWRFYHGISQEVRDAALLIRDDLSDIAEYQIYRDLIGFESIFEDWETSLHRSRDFAETERIRSDNAFRYASEINAENWATWKGRIIEFCKIESNDLATFPKFYEFLHEFAKAQPDLALELVLDHLDDVEMFTIPIYRGIWTTNRQKDLRSLLMNPAISETQLTAASRMFLGEVKDWDMLKHLLKVSLARGSERALSQLVEVCVTNFKPGEIGLIDDVFVPAVRELNNLKKTGWLHGVWYRPQLREFLKELSAEQIELVLQSFVEIERVSYEHEDFLSVIADRDVQRVIDLFGARLEREGHSRDKGYEALPFRFHSLHTALSAFPEAVIQSARRWFENNDRLFSFRGGRFVAISLPIIAGEVEDTLIEYVKQGSYEDLRFTLAVLRNYNGESFLYPLCREIADRLHRHQLLSELEIVLSETGVVTGQFGFSDEYRKRIEELKPWLNDERSTVREFATSFIERLRQQEKFHREQAEEEIELRKHEFGLDEPSSDSEA